MPRTYATLSLDLVEHAESFFAFLRAKGLRVAVEPSDLHFPNTPTLLGSRGGMEYIVEVRDVRPKLMLDAVKPWLNYARARGRETYVALVLPSTAALPALVITAAKDLGIGVFTTDNGKALEIAKPRDLTANIGVPELANERAVIRKLLRDCFSKVADGQIVDGFRDASSVLEKASKEHVRHGISAKRLTFIDSSGTAVTYSAAKIRKKTLGQTKDVFEQIVAPNHQDTVALNAMKSILDDRNAATHDGTNATVVRRIKRNTGRHLLAILNAIKALK